MKESLFTGRHGVWYSYRMGWGGGLAQSPPPQLGRRVSATAAPHHAPSCDTVPTAKDSCNHHPEMYANMQPIQQLERHVPLCTAQRRSLTQLPPPLFLIAQCQQVPHLTFSKCVTTQAHNQHQLLTHTMPTSLQSSPQSATRHWLTGLSPGPTFWPSICSTTS
jgi:hypothetical protein